MKWVAEGVFGFVFLFFLYHWRRGGRNTEEEPVTGGSRMWRTCTSLWPCSDTSFFRELMQRDTDLPHAQPVVQVLGA